MKPHVLFTAVSLAAALLGGAGCNGDAPETDTPLPVLENAGQLTLAGGRNRIVCRWSGMPSGGMTICLLFRKAGCLRSRRTKHSSSRCCPLS